MVLLAELPPEVVNAVLSYVDPEDLVSVSCTCRWLRDCIYDNPTVCRTVYCSYFDPPPNRKLDWEREILDYVKLKRICSSRASVSVKAAQLPFVYETTKRILSHATRMSPAVDEDVLIKHRRFRNAEILRDLLDTPDNRSAFLNRSSLYNRVRALPRVTRHRNARERSLYGQVQLPHVTTNANDGNTLQGDRASPARLRQMSAEMHCLMGTMTMLCLPSGTGNPADDIIDDPADLIQELRNVYPFAASKVYDMRENTLQTRWGPFLADGSGRVDWERLEAILVVLRNNITCKGLLKFPVMTEFWDTGFAGAWPSSYMPILHPKSTGGLTTESNLGDLATLIGIPGMGLHGPAHEEASGAEEDENADALRKLDEQDPYGISGTWMRVVCFLDYTEFFRFNFAAININDGLPRPPLKEDEELRLITMKIHVTHVDPPGPDDHPDYAVVRFAGTSYSMDNIWDNNGNSELQGTVRTTPEGMVHWCTFSLFGGVERWRSEGIQMGGHKSGRGVVGTWFDCNFDPEGPCGPTAFWKMHERNAETSLGMRNGFSYLLANSIEHGIRIVVNVNHYFEHLSAFDGDDDDDDDFDEFHEQEEEEDDYDEEDEDEDGSYHGPVEAPLTFEEAEAQRNLVIASIGLQAAQTMGIQGYATNMVPMAGHHMAAPNNQSSEASAPGNEAHAESTNEAGEQDEAA